MGEPTTTRRRPPPPPSLPPIEPLDLGVGGLFLSPRLKLLLTFFRSDPSVKPIDEWQLKRALLDFLRDSLSLTVPEEDLVVHKRPDLHKRKRDEPVASGTLFVRDLGFLKNKGNKRRAGGVEREGEQEEEAALWRRFMEWKDSVVGRTDGIELNLEGVKFRLSVEIPSSDDFERLKKSWEEFSATQSSGNRYSSRGVLRRPDTLVVTGVPSRWFAEPRVSSKPSMLVTHTIFSVLGKIRNLNVAADDDLGKKADDKGGILSGLHCKVWVQFENYNDFLSATKTLCGRSMHKEGSHLKADYEVSWDRDGYFRIVEQRTPKSYAEESSQPYRHPMPGHLRREAPRLQSEVTRFVSDSAHPKRFRE